MKLFNSKRGNWVDIVEYMGTALGIAIVVVLMGLFMISFFVSLDKVADNTTIIPQEALDIAEQAATTYPPAYDFIVPIIFIFFLVFSVWSARKIPSSHLLVWIYPFIALVLMLIALVTESVWQDFIFNDTFDSVRSIFYVTNFFLSYIRYFILVYCSAVGLALYAKDE